MTTTRIAACARDALADGEALRIDTPAARIALFHIGGAYYAVNDQCSHGNASMSEGYIEDGEAAVECPLHAARFCLKTGAALCQPATEPLQVYAVSVDDDTVYVDLPEAP